MNFLRQISSNWLRGAIPDGHSQGDSAGGGASQLDDRILVSRAQSGDYSAFDELVTRHRGKVYAMIVNMVKNDADAWDLAQDSFIKAWNALPKFENRSRFSTWMFRISHNVVYDWMRKRKIQADGELDDQLLSRDQIDTNASTAPRAVARPDQALENQELQGEIEAALAQLSDEHREAILLREVQGMEYKEIADIQGCSLGTVMSRLFYARKKLQNLLER
ncbi:RNA polymerase, sigma-24 subunit, RpoE [Rubritalea squalenifaciens DSM 18772]|uniref:RNA polymerase, sigma-24 subunit, RpoE n=1 Tax=Rubritalea squalenifaciens DSM 18772 TaxID=1123071 RepID=A0A1M6IA56_9BACT|nr:sigma-70 family RNA polymerase sigma factor [Rubritalea squalenifaciens]SHJ31341.1 RNA polymerase, sigma-24 subunit, RpoE [Rubritalea squalenifaciens DSM 18772]